MQKHKSKFLNNNLTKLTISDVQKCLRLNDLSELGDGTHYLDFDMLGLFSFQDWSLSKGIKFWFEFLNFLNIPPDTVTIPCHRPEWKELYSSYPVKIKFDKECVWSDGNIKGDCTEFYINDIEIGNIVYTLNRSLDCGFGLKRLEHFYFNQKINPLNPSDIIYRTINLLLKEGIVPSSKKHGYVLRSLIRKQWKNENKLPDNPLIYLEIERLQKIKNKIPKILSKHPDKTKEFYWETFGIDITQWQ